MTLVPTDPEQFAALMGELRELAAGASTEADARALTARVARITRAYRVQHRIGVPTGLAEQAIELDAGYRIRPHLQYLSDRIAAAVKDVEAGRNRMIAISMPPRSGKSTLISRYGPLWLLRHHPEWSIVTASHDGGLAAGWAAGDRKAIEDHPSLGIALARDGGAGAHWRTVEGGGLFSVSVRGALTGRGARVMIIDDPVANFVEAHSAVARQTLWDWWLSVAYTRLEAPYLVLVIMTRWHEDDLVGRLFSPDHEGDPAGWERISLPAIADQADDALGRALGEPLYSPLLNEDRNQALDRWFDVKRAVGSYVWSAMYQQRPAPAKGAIFDTGWWRFWTTDRANATEDGRVVYLDPSALTGGTWTDSWDTNFDSTETSLGSWVVGQRWVKHGPNRYLIAQQRGRWTFTQTLARMEDWLVTDNPHLSLCGHLVHERLIEKKANGAAIIDVLKTKIAGIKPINPTASKEARARAITPECESGNVLIPYPGDPGNEWVRDWLSEVRNFPHDAADDQVDAMTQALARLRTRGAGLVSVPGRMGAAWQQPRNVAAAALTDLSRARDRGQGPRR